MNAQDKLDDEAVQSRINANKHMDDSRREYMTDSNRVPIIGSQIKFELPPLDPDLTEMLKKTGGQIRLTSETLYLFQVVRDIKRCLAGIQELNKPMTDEESG